MYGLAAHNLSSQRWLFDRAEAAGVKLLLELAGFQAVPPAADAEASDPCGLWRDTPAYSFRAELERVVTHARSHPAILGYFLCDDCVGNRWNQEVTWPRNYRCVSSLAQVYSFVKTLDPIHVLAGAIDSGAWGWWFSDTVSLLPPTPAVLSALDLGQATTTVDGKKMPAQPTTQLSLDLFLCENYYANPRAHASTASSPLDWDRDGSLVQGLRHSAVFNSVGLWFPPSLPTPPTYTSAAAFRSVMWLGVLTAGMTHQLAFIFGEFCEASGCHADMTDQLGQWSSTELAPVLPAIRREFADTVQPGVQVPGDDLRARAWRNPATNGGGIYVVVVNLNAAPSAVNVTVKAPELEPGAWLAMQMVDGRPSGNSSVVHGELSGDVDASASNVYLLLPALAEDARRYSHQLKTEDSAPQQPPMPFRRLPGNASVLGRGPPGSFDACQAKYPVILKFNGTWMMWYNGRADDCFTGSVGLATSRGPAGPWTRALDGQPCLRHGPPGADDETKVDHPAVVSIGTELHMWYTAGGPEPQSNYTIMHATSPDGYAWTRSNGGRAIFRPAAAGWDSEQVLHPSVVQTADGRLHLFYNGVGPGHPFFLLGHATSAGPAAPFVRDSRPIMEPSQVGALREGYLYNVFATTLFANERHPRRIDLWYSAWALYSNDTERLAGPDHSGIVHASSLDAKTWRKDDVPTLVNGPIGAPDGYATFAPCVIRGHDPGELLMYYSMGSYAKHNGLSQQYSIGLATGRSSLAAATASGQSLSTAAPPHHPTPTPPPPAPPVPWPPPPPPPFYTPRWTAMNPNSSINATYGYPLLAPDKATHTFVYRAGTEFGTCK